MKYINEYNKSQNIKDFVKLLVKNGVKETTAKRRYYDYRQKFGKKENYESTSKIKPNYLKLIEINDIKRLQKNITREFLLKHGFNNYEINWLIDEGYLNEVK